LSLCPELADAVSVAPSCALPLIVGVVTVGAASVAAAVGALIFDALAPWPLVAVALTSV
jgi:hypothetical protein